MVAYAGIGSRRTPEPIALFFRDLAMVLARDLQWVLRSGGAQGADLAFEQGVDLVHGQKEIFTTKDTTPEARSWGKKYHPVWNHLTFHQQELIARNTFQVLGENLDCPAIAVICWTPDGADGTTILTSKQTGGTGQAIRIAADLKIPVFNLQQAEAKDALRVFLEPYMLPAKNG